MTNDMTVAQWQRRLADTFTVDGLIGGSLRNVHSAEDDVGNHIVKTYIGQNVLFDSFQGFFIETLTIASRRIADNGWPTDRPNYPVALVFFSNLFRRCRACEVLFLKGYPLDAYALMRDVKDRLFMLAGVANNLITFSGIIGAPDVPASNPEYKRKIIRNRKNAEHRISRGLIGANSGLSTEVQADLQLWDDLFHVEVHGGGLSLVGELLGLSEGKIPEIGPTSIAQSYLMYINRSTELGWMIVRLLPFLQASENAFGSDWSHKYQVLDESFRYMATGLGSLGKPFGPSFITMIDSKFAFNQPFYYFEADETIQ
jgi:hypothetical protein